MDFSSVLMLSSVRTKTELDSPMLYGRNMHVFKDWDGLVSDTHVYAITFFRSTFENENVQEMTVDSCIYKKP